MGRMLEIGVIGLAALVVVLDVIIDVYAGYECFGRNAGCGGHGNGDIFIFPVFWAPVAFVGAIIVAVAVTRFANDCHQTAKISVGWALAAITFLPYAWLFFDRDEGILLPLVLFLPVSIPMGIAALVILVSQTIGQTAKL